MRPESTTDHPNFQGRFLGSARDDIRLWVVRYVQDDSVVSCGLMARLKPRLFKM
jgi:hypothetical protein